MRLYIGRFRETLVEAGLRELLTKYGAVTSVEIARNDEGISRCFGHAEMPSTDQALGAIAALDNSVFQGKRLMLQVAISAADVRAPFALSAHGGSTSW